MDEGFEAPGLPAQWIAADADGDGYGWEMDGSATASTGLRCASSASYVNGVGATTPDNWLISRGINLTGYSVSQLTYGVAAQDGDYTGDHLEVWVSTTGNRPADFTDPVDDYTATEATWQERTVDLSAYTGETIYLAFRHCKCTDRYRISIDDVRVHGAGATTPLLAYAPVSQHFGPLTAGQGFETSFEIWNRGAGTLDWNTSPSEPWLSCHPVSGSTDSEPVRVHVTVAANDLALAASHADIHIASNGGEGAFTVHFQNDWPGFRGPDGMGVSAARGLPVVWDAERNMAWKTALPGGGTSSPILLGDRIYITSYSGYGVRHAPGGRLDQLTFHLIALDRDTGQLTWEQVITAEQPEETNIRDHGYAANTPAADAERVYAFFGKTGVFAFDHDGTALWQADVGSETSGWGTGASLLLFEDSLIVNASVESESLIALDRATGQERWRVTGIKEAWNTPVVVTADSGRRELVLARHGDVLGLDPRTGASLWSCKTDIKWYMVPTAVADHGVVYYLGGRSGTTALAVRAGGNGDVTATHRLWTRKTGSNVTSPLLLGEHLYWMHESKGMAYCAKARTGELVYAEKLSGAGQVYASPLLADGRLYYLDRSGRAFVLPAQPEFEEPIVNELRDGSRFDASPAVAGKRLLIRSGKFLYCVGE
jgi:hypothetical protein